MGLLPFSGLSPAVRVILSINLGVFLLAFVGALFRIPFVGELIDSLVLSPSAWWQIWRLPTYAFVHYQPMHFLFNMLMLWMFAEEVCQWLGQRSFWTLYLGSGIFAGAFSFPFYLWGSSGMQVHILGASGALFGVMAAYAKLFPDRVLLLFFVIPMKVRHAIWVLIAIDLFMIPSNSQVAHLTHLGGVLGGYLYMLLRERLLQTPSRGTKTFYGDVRVGYTDPQKELDAVLSKVSRKGLGSLSPDEVRILQNASEQIKLHKGR